MPDEIPAGIACITCDAMNITSMLFTHQGGTGYYCRNGHKYPDSGELFAANPRKLPVPARQTIQQGYENVSISIPMELKANLLTKFGGDANRIAQTLASILHALSQTRCIMFNEEDIEQIEKHTGSQLKNAREIVGLVWALKEEVKVAKSAQPVVEQANGKDHEAQPGMITVNLQSRIHKLNVLVKARGVTPQQICEEALGQALDHGWA